MNASYEVSDTLTAAASLNYMSLNGSAYESAAKDIGYQADQIFEEKSVYDFNRYYHNGDGAFLLGGVFSFVNNKTNNKLLIII